MNTFDLSDLRNSSVWGTYRTRKQVDLNPPYQREGGIWTLENRQLLIDTIINGFDVPKIYMHKLNSSQTSPNSEFDMAVIDGKQRLSAIWDFIGGKFALSKEFEYLADPTIRAEGLTYSDLAREHPEIKADFDAYGLDVIVIQADELEIIEDMFSRLNEAMPLNAAEKRNAWPGPLPKAVREISNHLFFTEKVPFSNKRYRHLDLAAKMLFQKNSERSSDTKKAYIDNFFRSFAEKNDQSIIVTVEGTKEILSTMSGLFTDGDPLLRSVGMIMLYFLAFERAIDVGQQQVITRPKLESFERLRKDNREIAETDIAKADYDLLEFDRYTQSPNDAVALRFRLAVLDRISFEGALGFAKERLSQAADEGAVET